MTKETIDALKHANNEVTYAMTSNVSLQNKRERMKNLLFGSRNELIALADEAVAKQAEIDRLKDEIKNLEDELAQADEDYKKLKDSMKPPKKQKVTEIEQPGEQ